MARHRFGRRHVSRFWRLAGRRGRLSAGTSLLAVGLLVALLAQPAVASAATTAKHEITANWAGTPIPTDAPYGATRIAEFHVNTNDANDPHANDPVTNVRATLTATNGVFVSIPAVCKTSGVTPPSAISNNGTQLLCNLGTIKEGTASVIQAPVKANGAVGTDLSVSGTATSDSAVAPAGPAATPKLPITGTHGMDLAISAPNQNYQGAVLPSRYGGTRETVMVDYGLSMTTGSIPGPATYTFGLDVTPTVAGQMTGLQWEGCAAVDDASQATGIPYSDAPHPNRTNNPTCTISGSGNHYTVTLTGLDYSMQHVPTVDSLGNPIPSSTTFVAAGQLIFSFPNPITASTGVTFVATPTPFTFTDGQTLPETNPANDSSDTTIVLPGTFAIQWAPIGPGVGRAPWDAQYFAAPGAGQGVTFPIPGAGSSTNPGTIPDNSKLPAASNADSTAWSTYTGPGGPDMAGSCSMLSNPADFVYTQAGFFGENGASPSNITTAHIWYRTDAINTKTETCGEPVGVAGSPWTEATLSPSCAARTAYISPIYSDDDCLVNLPPGVTAVKMTWNPAVDTQTHHTLRVWGYIPSTAVVGSDSWTVGAFNTPYDPSTVFPGYPTLNNYINISPTPAVYATIPGCTYAAPECNTNGQRDAMRIQGANGAITKTTPDTTAAPGVPVTYNISAEADLSVATPPAQTFPVVDTLPTGMTYVAGSGTPTPAISTNGSGQQVLTWTFTNVPANTPQHITYQAQTAPDSSITPGTVLTNTAEVDVVGDNREAAARQASASVTVPDNGATTLGKSVEANVLSFYGDSSAWDLVINSQDPVVNPFTDTIDVLPYKGDAGGTNIDGTYTITGVTAPAGSTSYYTTAARASLSNDPRAASNGGTPGSITGNTVNWTAFTGAPPAGVTGIRVIGPALDPGAAQTIRIAFTTPAGSNCATPAATDNKPGQKIVNTANSIAGHTDLPMLSSATTTIGNCYALDLKKYVLAKGGNPAGTPGDPNSDWHDANTPADYPQYVAGDTVTYAIVVRNIGTGTLTNIPVVDDHYSACNFTVPSLAPGASASKQCTATAVVGTTVNTASATITPPCGTGTCPPPIDVHDPAGVLVPQFPHVAKTSVPAAGAPVSPGQKVTYTITVTEPAGSVAPYLAPSLTDPLTGVLDDATYNNDATATTSAGNAGTVTFDPASKVLSWKSALLTPGQVVTITYSVTVNNPLTGDGTLTNPVTMPHTNCDPASADPADCIVTHQVKSFVVSKVADQTDVTPGEKVTYTITVHNNGQVAYTAPDLASFTDDLTQVLDDATYNGDAAASAGTVGYTTPTLSWSGPLAVGATVTVTYSVTVNSPDTGDKVLRNSVVGGSNCPAGSADPDCTVVIPGPALQVKKTVNVAYADPGQTVTYTVVATNVGAGDYTAAKPASFTDDLTKVLDDADYNGDAKATAGTVSYAKPNLSWTGALASKASVTITYTVTVHNPDTGDLSLDNTVTTPPGITSNCADGSTDPNCATHTPIEQYHVAKTSDKTTVAPGDVIHYTITVTNTGKVAYTTAHPASLVDDMTQVLDDADYNNDATATAGTLAYTAPNLTWSGPLPIAGTVTITYTMTVDNPDHGDGKLLNVVITPTDPTGHSAANCPTGSTDPVCSTTATLASGAAPSGGGGSLPFTGSDITMPLILGSLLLGIGGLLTLAGIRRRRTS